MEHDKLHRIPELDASNYAPWYLALQTYAATIQATEHLDQNPPAPIEPEDLQNHYGKKNRLLAAVLSSVSSKILGLLIVPGERPTPHELVEKIIRHITQSSKEDHQYLKTEAESITFKDDTTIDEYIKKHTDVRQKMIAAQYPDISEESTTVEFLIAGLRNNITITTILGPILANKPTTIKTFTRTFKELYNLYHPLLTVTSTAPRSTRFTGDYGTAARPYNINRRQYRRPYYPQQRIPPQQLCQFHMAFGRPCNHTDAQCRDPRHPKFRQMKPQAMLTQTTPTFSPYQYHVLPQPPHPPVQHPLPQPQADVLSDMHTEVNGKFILDSGAHPTHLKTPTSKMTQLTQTLLTHTALNQKTPCSHHGMLQIHPHQSKNTINTYAVVNRNLRHNLLSVHDLAHRYGLVYFTPHYGYIVDTHRMPHKLLARAKWKNSQYELSGTIPDKTRAYTSRTIAYKRPKSCKTPPKIRPSPHPSRTTKKTALPPPVTTHQINNTHPTTRNTQSLQQLTYPDRHTSPNTLQIQAHNWHLRLNHAHPRKLKLTARQRLIPTMPTSLPYDTPITCSACKHAQAHPSPHKRTPHPYPPGAYVSSDTCGPIKPTSRHGNNHILIIICAASRFVLAHFIRNRKDIPQHIDKTLQHIRQRMELPLTDFRSDNAKEYTSSNMQAIYAKHQVTHHLRTPHQPQENSIAERINRTIMNTVRANLNTSGLDDTYWEDAARDAIFKYNLLHHSAINTSPYHKWHNQQPTIKRLYTFGQLGTIPIYAPKSKLQPRADPARYMYAESLSHIMVLNLRTSQYQSIRGQDFTPHHKHKDPTATTTQAFHTATSRHKDVPTKIAIDTPPPATLAQARNYPDATYWQHAHDTELHNLDKYRCIQWLPPDFRPPTPMIIPLMMLYRYKRSSNGNVTQRKARCNLRGDLMQPGLHYDPKHTTTYTADRTTQRLLFALHAKHQMPLEHFDITSAYLHEKYDHHQPVYVRQMPLFDGTMKHNSTYGELKGNLYGSPPAAYYYNRGLKTFLFTHKFVASDHDPCLYIKVTSAGIILVSTTIDDFLVLASTTNLIDQLYTAMKTKYKVKRLGKPTRFLNWTITYTPTGSVHISQPDAIAAILKQTGMTNCNPTLSPYAHTTTLDQQQSTQPLPPSQATTFRHILGEIRYITDCTRPDITYATNRLAQHMKQPQVHHWHALKALLRYLKGTQKHGLRYTAPRTQQDYHKSDLRTYSDADYANAKDRKSISGNVHCIGQTPISWCSKKQSIVALSTTEAEYISATFATQHTQWLRKLLQTINIRDKTPTPHYIDSRSAVLIAENQAPTKRRKYLDLRHHYLQHHVTEKHIQLHRIATENMLADILTKPLHRDRFRHLCQRLQVTPPPHSKQCNAATGDCQTADA